MIFFLCFPKALLPGFPLSPSGGEGRVRGLRLAEHEIHADVSHHHREKA
jgi:hypothetical protein